MCEIVVLEEVMLSFFEVVLFMLNKYKSYFFEVE